MLIKTFPVGAFQCNCTIVGNPKTKKALVIDPGDEAERVCQEVCAMGLEVTHIIHTHAHIDHIGATKAVHQELGGHICLHKDDQMLYDNMSMQADLLGLNMDCAVLPISQYIEHNDVIESDAELRTRVLHTPGHTPGSACFFIDDFSLEDGRKTPLLFSGDTLFLRSIGRTDLWGGDHNQILASIKEKLFTLPEQTIVIAGHGPQTSVGAERDQNPFFRA